MSEIIERWLSRLFKRRPTRPFHPLDLSPIHWMDADADLIAVRRPWGFYRVSTLAGRSRGWRHRSQLIPAAKAADMKEIRMIIENENFLNGLPPREDDFLALPIATDDDLSPSNAFGVWETTGQGWELRRVRRGWVRVAIETSKCAKT